ncbi:MAG: hypothetical protein SF187_02675 [Deltaproteobacteria bacterium]|nr:hypothetical protein [Deltaproteobacteria bacterium]
MSVFGNSPRDPKRPPSPGGARWLFPEGWLQSDECKLSAYLPFESLVANRRVLDVNGVSAAKDRLRRAKARTVMGGGDAPWDLPPQSVDVVLALGEANPQDDLLLREVARVLAPGGFAALRFGASSVSSPASLAAALGPVFPTVDLVGQIPIVGFTFDRGGSPGVVVAEDFFPVGAAPTHWLALCALGEPRPWAGLDTWLVPLARPSEAANAGRVDVAGAKDESDLRVAELTREREYLRELLMTVQDERDRLARLSANLRRDADRGLARMSEQAAALEVLTLERDQALRRAAAAESLARESAAPIHDFDAPKTRPTSA